MSPWLALDHRRWPRMSNEHEPTPVKRRDFLKVLGVGAAATTMLGCAQEQVEKLIPYLVSPDQTVPGVSTYYATTCRECAAACGVIAETRDGRTIKLEGNPDHPVNRGALCARGQAALQGLYNPDRYRGPMVRRNGALQKITWDDALELFSQKLGETRSKGGAASAVFINQHETGSFPGFLDAWLAGFGMPTHLSYDAGADHAAIAAHRQSYGVAWPRFDFAAARLVVSGRDPTARTPRELRARVAHSERCYTRGPGRASSCPGGLGRVDPRGIVLLGAAGGL